jgi:peptide/nickel transport system permease protein
VSVPVVIGVTLLTFLAMTLTAGSYIPGIDVAGNLRPGDLERMRHALGLDRPLWLQYLSWLLGILHGDFGRSMIDGAPITRHILDRLPNTLELTAAALLLGLLLSIPIGVIGATRRGTAIDGVLNVVSVAGFAVPQFWLGLMMILVFSVYFHVWGLPWLPSSGAYDARIGGDLGDRALHLVLPAIVLAFVYVSIWSRFTRSSMITVLAQDYVRTARAKGMSERRVIYHHALRNGLMPVVTLIGLEIPRLVSGSLVIEVVFNWPGIGRFMYESAQAYDFTAVMGVTAFVGIMVVGGNLLADFSYAVIDPRIQHS